MAHISRISGCEIDPNRWMVSLLNTGNPVTGHAMIVVEGVVQDTIFVGQYEVLSKIIIDQTAADVVQRTIGNAQGYIAEIRVIEKTGHYTREYANYSHKSWYAEPEKVRTMITAIKDAQKRLQQAIENGEELPFKYQTAGAYRWGGLGGNGGDNCVTWAEKQLILAHVGNGIVLGDRVKAIPELHTTICVVL